MNRLLNNPIHFRYGFIILIMIGIIANNIFPYNANFYIVYIFAVIFLGIGFYNFSIWFIIIVTTGVVTLRYLLIADSVYGMNVFLIHLFTYSMIALISSGLMRSMQKVKMDSIELMKALANALDSRDPYTMHHSENVAAYSLQIAQKMKLSKLCCEVIRKGALLHDIGKIGIPENVLSKNGRLTDEEYEIIKRHPILGHNMIKHIGAFHKDGILDIVLYHHERYDGKGYPAGLKGNDIPLFARIVAVADTFDAMTSKRIYREKLDEGFALEEIRKNKGTQFDPEIADVFLSFFEKENHERT